MESLQHKVLDFPEPDESFDPNFIPEDGTQYLQKVAHERKHCPDIVVKPFVNNQTSQPLSWNTLLQVYLHRIHSAFSSIWKQNSFLHLVRLCGHSIRSATAIKRMEKSSNLRIPIHPPTNYLDARIISTEHARRSTQITGDQRSKFMVWILQKQLANSPDCSANWPENAGSSVRLSTEVVERFDDEWLRFGHRRQLAGYMDLFDIKLLTFTTGTGHAQYAAANSQMLR